MRQQGQSWKSWAAAIAAVVPALAVCCGSAEAQMNSKWLTVVLPGEPPNLDGCQSSRQVQGRVVKQNIVETLIERSAADFALKPRLAISWDKVDDLNWRIKLRDGVTFHDGTPMNAAAVKYSLDRTITATALACSDRNKGFNDLAMETTVVDNLTLNMKTSRPEPILPMKLANQGIVAMSAALDKNSLQPVGTGPYVFDTWQPGNQITMKRNDKYWGAKPQVEGVRFIWRSETAVRAAMVKVGEADIALGIGQQDANDPQLDHSHLNSETFHLRIDAVTPPLNDRRVRLAMNYAIDKKAPLGTVLPKETQIATQIVVPSIPGHNHELDKNARAYDPAKAKQLLAEAKAAGVLVDKEILLISYPENFPNAGELMEAYLAMFKAVGLNMKMLTVEAGQYASWNSKPYPDPRPPYVLQSSHDNLSGDPVFSVNPKYGCSGGSSGYCDPEFDKEVTAVSVLGGQARTDGWSKLFRTIYEDLVPDVMLYHMIGFTRVGKRINFTPDVTTNNEVRFQEITFK